MKLRLRGNFVAIEKLKKAANKASFIVMPESEQLSGLIRYVGPDASTDLKVGQSVYFGDKFQKIRLPSSEVHVMEDTNIIAVQEDEP